MVGPAVLGTTQCGGGFGAAVYMPTIVDFVKKNLQWVFITIGIICGALGCELIAGRV